MVRLVRLMQKRMRQNPFSRRKLAVSTYVGQKGFRRILICSVSV